MTKDIKNILFRPKPTGILLHLLDITEETKTKTYLSKKTDCVYSHTSKIVKKFEKEELVLQTSIGRIQELSLTKKGYILAKDIEYIYSLLEVNKNE